MVKATTPLKALICENDEAVAAALAATVKGLYGFEIVASVRCCEDLIAAAAAGHRPGLVVVDLAMAGELGLGVVGAVLDAAPSCAVVLVVPPLFAGLRARAIEEGAADLVSLSDLRPLWRCLEQIHSRAHGTAACPTCPAVAGTSTAAALDYSRLHVSIGSVRRGQVPSGQPLFMKESADLQGFL